MKLKKAKTTKMLRLIAVSLVSFISLVFFIENTSAEENQGGAVERQVICGPDGKCCEVDVDIETGNVVVVYQATCYTA